VTAQNKPRVVAGLAITATQLQVYVLPGGESYQVRNDPDGCRFLKEKLKERAPSVIVMACPGNASRLLAALLAEDRLPVAIVDHKELKRFAKQQGMEEKLDAPPAPELLARFGEATNLQPQHLEADQLLTLGEMIVRQGQLMNIRAVEQNRRCRTKSLYIQLNHDILLDSINAQLRDIEEQICHLIKSSPVGRARERILHKVE
jgi:hypothetical protein